MLSFARRKHNRRAQIKQAMAYLTNPALGDYPVQFIVETQLLLDVYLKGRTRMHLLYASPHDFVPLLSRRHLSTHDVLD